MSHEAVKKENEEDSEIEAEIEREEKEGFHWADGIAEQLIKTGSKTKQFVCAAGITPSGTVHIGNFREAITVDLVARALRDRDKKTRFIYSWDDFDRLRKVPKNMPKPDVLEQYIGMPVTKTPDTFGCHKSYAEHFEREFEEVLPVLGIASEIIYQAKKYENCDYAEEIKFILKNREKIKAILDKYKTELTGEDWWPVQIYCEKCKRDTTKIISWDNEHILEYECKCGYKGRINFSKKGIVKLPWRIDWPMRWHFEQVDFEPGGKEHSTPGGSRTTAKEIMESVYNEKAPLYLKYDFIVIKGEGGKMSSSLGNVIRPKDCLEIYEPQILRYLFVKTRPNTEFAISFDADVLKIYSEYDSLEENYFANKLGKKEKRIYELSQVKENSNKKIFAPQFRQLSELVQFKDDFEILKFYKKEIKTQKDENRTLERIKLARNWLKFAPPEFVFSMKEKIDAKLDENEKRLFRKLKQTVQKAKTEDELADKMRELCTLEKTDIKDFFKTAYQIILGKEQGPRLSTLIVLNKERVLHLLKQI